jgi:hypothetical protein
MPRKRHTLVPVLLSLVILLPCCAGITLKDYEPKSQEEESIKSTLLAYEKAWNNQSKAELLPLLHEDFVIWAGKKRRIIFTKARYAFYLRDIFVRYRYLTFGSPTLGVREEQATAHLPVSIDGRTYQSTFRLVKQTGRWFILEWELG